MVTGTDSEKKWDALGTRDFEDSLCVCQTGQHQREMHRRVLAFDGL